MLCFRSYSVSVKEDCHIHMSKNHNHDEEKLSWNGYEDDFYQFHHLEECQINTTSKGSTVDCEMRKNVVDLLIDTHYGLELAPETLYLSVNVLDRFLSKSNFEAITKKKFEFLGLASLLLASKYEERGKLGVYELEYITQYSCTLDEIRDTEHVILQKLDWVLTVPTPYVFLVRNINACLLSDEDKIMENMVIFFSELSLTHYPIVCDYKPSIIAASAVYCARVVLKRYPFWSKALKICTRYSEKNLRSCVKVMMKLWNETCIDGSMDVFSMCCSTRILQQSF